MARLDEAGIASARVNDLRQVWEHAQLAARQRWVEIDTPAGPVRAALPPGALDVDAVRMGAVPALGQHNDAILHELGYDAAQRAHLRAEGAV
jgi:itaconate CoA-transferase